jgi:hypothetical protein
MLPALVLIVVASVAKILDGFLFGLGAFMALRIMGVL